MRPLELRTDSDWVLFSYPVGGFHYRKIEKDTNVTTLLGDVVVKAGECLLYSVSKDNEDNRGLNVGEDTIIWPPLKTLERSAGLLN